MRKQLPSVPVGFFIVILLDLAGMFLIEANNAGIAFIVFTSAYMYCVIGFYVLYRVLVNARGL